jgi:hypothetical protein
MSAEDVAAAYKRPRQSSLWDAVNNFELKEINSGVQYDRVLAELDDHDVNEEDEDSQSLLISCCNQRMAFFNIEVCKLLVMRDADISATFENKTAVQWLYHRGNVAGMKLFEEFLDVFFAPVTRTSTETNTETTTFDTTTKVKTTTTTTVITNYRHAKRVKIDENKDKPRLSDAWRLRQRKSAMVAKAEQDAAEAVEGEADASEAINADENAAEAVEGEENAAEAVENEENA